MRNRQEQDGVSSSSSNGGGGGGGGGGNSPPPPREEASNAAADADTVTVTWTEEEQKTLEEGLVVYTSGSLPSRYANIACLLGNNKTIRDVALRVKWMSLIPLP